MFLRFALGPHERCIGEVRRIEGDEDEMPRSALLGGIDERAGAGVVGGVEGIARLRRRDHRDGGDHRVGAAAGRVKRGSILQVSDDDFGAKILEPSDLFGGRGRADECAHLDAAGAQAAADLRAEIPGCTGNENHEISSMRTA